MTETLRNTRKFASDVAQCMKCGFCSYFCPVYREERDEKGLARGKSQLIRFLLKGEQTLTGGFYEAIDNCLLCKTCVQFCPAKTRIDHAVVAKSLADHDVLGRRAKRRLRCRRLRLRGGRPNQQQRQQREIQTR